MMRRCGLVVLILLLASAGLSAPADAAAGGSSLVVTRHTRTVRVDARSVRSVVVRCPKGTQASGGGFSMGGYGGFPGARVLASRPFDSDDRDRIPDDGWKVTARNDQNNKNDLTAWVVCAENSNFTYHSISTNAPPGIDTSAVALCNAPDRVTGGGASIASRKRGVGIGVTTPADWTDGDGTTDDAWSANMTNGSNETAKLTVFAICDAIDGYTYPTTTAVAPGTGGQMPVATCTSGPVMGGGLSHGGDPTEIVTGISGPVQQPPAQAWTTGVWNFGLTIAITTTAVCLVQ